MNIQSMEGYLSVTGSHFKMTSKGGSDKYFEITPDGAHAHKGMFKATRPGAYAHSEDKGWGVWTPDWIPQAVMAVHRNQLMTPEDIERQGQRYILNTPSLN